jgi:hypothetical protein
MGGVKNDVLAGTVLMNDGQYQHPNYPAPTMTYAEAKAWHKRETALRRTQPAFFDLSKHLRRLTSQT